MLAKNDTYIGAIVYDCFYNIKMLTFTEKMEMSSKKHLQILINLIIIIIRLGFSIRIDWRVLYVDGKQNG